MGHILKKCRMSYKCYNCDEKNHHTFICESIININDNKDSKIQKTADENEEKVATLIGVKSDLLLQTADCIISNPGKWKALKLKVLLDPGSQRM